MFNLPWKRLDVSLGRMPEVPWEWGFSCSLPVVQMIGTGFKDLVIWRSEGAEENRKVSCCDGLIFVVDFCLT